MQLLKDQREVKIKDVKKVIARSTYYSLVIKRVYRINKVLREIDPKLYLAEPTFSIASKEVFASIKRCELIELDMKHDFFILRCKGEK